MGDNKEVALAKMDPQALMERAISEGSGIETLERLVALRKEVRNEEARQAWHTAMAQFQKRCPPIVKTKEAQIATRSGGGYKYRYAPLDHILSVVTPILTDLGLHVGFRVRQEKGHVIATCRISHEFGHEEDSGEVAMPVEQAYEGKGANPAQRVGIAQTYAKRYALLGMLGISPEDDPDAKGQTAPVVEQPRRASEKKQPESDKPASAWHGIVKEIDSRSGTTKGKPWTLYKIVGEDGMEFKTFDKEIVDFAREAGSSEVSITFKEGTKGGLIAESIEPYEEQQELPQ